MSLLDYFYPDPPIPCPVCGEVLDGWQGWGGLCMLLYWRQGERHPFDTGWDKDTIDDVGVFLESCLLPERFTISTYNDCKCQRRILAYGWCEEGVWRRTELVSHANFITESYHSVKDVRQIKSDLERWLSGKQEW